MPFDLTTPRNPIDAKRAAIEAAKAASTGKKPDALVRYRTPGECADRIRVVFDDSGSMSGELENAKTGVVEFLRNCIPNQTAVAVHFMNTTAWNTALRSDLPQLSADVLEVELRTAGTPFFNTLKKALEATPILTRLVAFTDGAPTDSLNAEDDKSLQSSWGSSALEQWMVSARIIIKIAKATGGGIPIDTVYFGAGASYEQRNMDLLRFLSSETGGYFLHFNPAKVNFRTAFKYLAPVNRLQLSSGSFRAAIESGVQK